jgi:protein O-mannosyl-transferase
MTARTGHGARVRALRTDRSADSQDPASSRREAAVGRGHRALTLLLLAGGTFAAFAGVLRNGWTVFDDPQYVTDNPFVNRGLTAKGVLWSLHTPHGGNWHPLTSWSHMLDVQLFGLAPAGHHAVSLVLHVLTSVMLAVVLFRLTRAWWRSALVAGLFALHPLRVESVAWISERKDVLSGLLFVLTIEAYRRWVARPSAGRYGLVLLGLALGLMSKPMLVTLPFVLVLLDVWPLGRLKRFRRNPEPGAPARSLAGLIMEKWPLWVLVAVSSALTMVFQSLIGATPGAGRLPAANRLLNALVSYWRYVGKTLWPSDLAVFYPFSGEAQVTAGVVGAIALAAVTAWVLLQFRRRPYLAIGWFWYVGMLVPVIGLVQVGGQAFADRYTYLPTIGLSIVLVWGLAEVVAGSRAGRAAAVCVSAVLLAGLAVATWRQVGLWRDDRTLFNHTLAITGDNALAQQCLGEALLRSGDPLGAVPHFEEALRLRPGLYGLHGSLGSALGALGRFREAEFHLRAALREGETTRTHHNLGSALAGQGRLDEAIPEFETAVRLGPDEHDSLQQLAAVYAAVGRRREAVRCWQRAIESARRQGDGAMAAQYAQQLEAYLADSASFTP